MPADVTDFAAERAQRTGDCRAWSVREMLEHTADQVDERGWTKALVVLYRPSGEDQFFVDSRVAGCSTLEARGLMLTNIRDEVLGDDA